MKTKIIVFMLLGQLALMVNISAQAVGITTSTTTATTFPASTLDVQGSFGMNLATNPTNALLAGAVVLYNNSSSGATLALPTITTTNTYLNRIYILANAYTSAWAITQTAPTDGSTSQNFYYTLANGTAVLVPANSSVIIISDGKNWVQIK